MIQLNLPSGAEQFDAAVFSQSGEFVECGHREACELKASEIGGLYCWVVGDRAVVRRDFECEED